MNRLNNEIKGVALLLAVSLAPLLVSCDTDSGEVDTSILGEPAPETEVAAARMHRLTQIQYKNVIADIFGDSILVAIQLEPDIRVDGLTAIGAAHGSISPIGVERYEKAAFSIAKQLLEDGETRNAVVSCTPSGNTDDTCARQVLESVGLKVWRRPLTTEELDRLVGYTRDASETLSDFYGGLEFGIAALLQSPNFLFRIELGESAEGNENVLRFSNFEMASRLSFFLWNTTPDEELLTAAKNGELITDAGLEKQATRLLESPRARQGVRNFFSDLYNLFRMDQLAKDPTLFPHMHADVGPDSREETLRFLENLVFDEQADYREFFTSRKTFVNRRLASLYDVPAPSLEGFGAFTWPESGARSGLLTHLSILANYSHQTASSATLRGKFVRKVLLCGVLLPPPVDVDTSFPEPTADAPTLRDRVKEHLTNPVCNSCHIETDPIGLGLENFDAIGRFREKDNGAEIDASGDVDGIVFEDAKSLGQAIAAHPKLRSCFVKNVYRYATGHMEEKGEAALLEYLTKRFVARNNEVLALFKDVVMSPGFRYASPPILEEGEE